MVEQLLQVHPLPPKTTFTHIQADPSQMDKMMVLFVPLNLLWVPVPISPQRAGRGVGVTRAYVVTQAGTLYAVTHGAGRAHRPVQRQIDQN